MGLPGAFIPHSHTNVHGPRSRFSKNKLDSLKINVLSFDILFFPENLIFNSYSVIANVGSRRTLGPKAN